MRNNKRSRLRTTKITLAAITASALLLVPAVVSAEAALAAGQTSTSMRSQLTVQDNALAAAAAPSSADAFDPAEVRSFVDSYFAKPEVASKLAGALVVIVKDGQVLLNQGYGYADIAAKKPIDPETTLFRMASITKAVTATAAMQLAEQGKLDLHQDVAAYMPDIRIKNDTGTPVTVEHFLTHTAGFDYTDASGQGEEIGLEDYLKQNEPTVVYKPGEAYRYDNLGYTMLGYIVQNVSGEPFEQYVDRHIFAPLGMKHTTMLVNGQTAAQLATGYTFDQEPYPVYPNVPTIAPEGGMLSTGADMANFIIAHLNGGKLGDARILEEKTEKLMQQTHYEAAPGIPIMSYGFETFLHQVHNGQFVIGKGGDLAGYHSWMWLLPEQQVGGMVIVNSDASASVREDFFAAFMNHYYPAKPETKPSIALTSDELARFTGIYRNLRTPLFASQVEVQDGILTVRDSYGTHTLRPVGSLVFEDENGAAAVFKADEDGDIKYLYYNMPDSLSEKMGTPGVYDDLAADSPYAASIYFLRALEVFDDAGKSLFQPQSAVTRADFVSMIARLSGMKLSNNPVVFADLQGHPQAALVQTITELGILNGTPGMMFEPDRAITRQEAASIIWRIAHDVLGAPALQAKLSTSPSPWANEAVQFVVAAGLYGPEVQVDASGAADYMPGNTLLRQEAAVLLAKLIENLMI
ncbi:serine hydrolase [Paenibacillus xylaniclasticus]|uniref:serine hydrolase n=1 Tax=Paenibacillus xylaniclasticus TaxID=588083 RepID=UPI000FDA1940|nr:MULTISPECIES: serine hydrolase [Paenibacillus]GFN32174.1 hypothetical protein PCURB6_24340 [Paenibacillus curdlanolyticus]